MPIYKAYFTIGLDIVNKMLSPRLLFIASVCAVSSTLPTERTAGPAYNEAPLQDEDVYLRESPPYVTPDPDHDRPLVDNTRVRRESFRREDAQATLDQILGRLMRANKRGLLYFSDNDSHDKHERAGPNVEHVSQNGPYYQQNMGSRYQPAGYAVDGQHVPSTNQQVYPTNHQMSSSNQQQEPTNQQMSSKYQQQQQTDLIHSNQQATLPVDPYKGYHGLTIPIYPPYYNHYFPSLNYYQPVPYTGGHLPLDPAPSSQNKPTD